MLVFVLSSFANRVSLYEEATKRDNFVAVSMREFNVLFSKITSRPVNYSQEILQKLLVYCPSSKSRIRMKKSSKIC